MITQARGLDPRRKDKIMAELIKIDRNGTKYYEGMITCDRCGGKGIYFIGVCNGQLVPSWVDRGVCFKCGGLGKVHGKWKEYTPEYAEKLEARRRAKAEAQAKAFAEEEAQREAERKAKEEDEFETALNELMNLGAERIERERQEAEEKARKAISKHVGEIGDKVDLDVVLEKRAWFDVPSFRGYGMDTMYIFTFRDDLGNALVWKTSKGLAIESGTKVHLTGTIKAHDEYMDEKQTVLTRCKVKAGEQI